MALCDLNLGSLTRQSGAPLLDHYEVHIHMSMNYLHKVARQHCSL